MDFDFDKETINPTGSLSIGGTAAVLLPAGTTAQRPAAPLAGMIRYNTTLLTNEWFNGTTWVSFSSGGTSTDQYVRISATDTVSDYLQPKLLAGTGISIVKSAAGNETLTINNSSIVSTDQNVIQIRTTGTFTMASTLTAVTFNVADVLNNSSVLNWTTGTNITVGAAGLYFIMYVLPRVGGGGTRTMTGTVYLNGTTPINGSASSSTNTNGNNPNIVGSCIVSLAATNTLQLRVSDSRNGEVMPAGVVMQVVRLSAAVGPSGPQGIPGADGAPGSGSSINVSDEGVTIPTGPFTNVNFTGAGVAATAGAGGIVNISIPGGTAILKSFVYYPASLDNPVNSSWVINALAPMITDPTYGAFNVRQFNGTIEQGVGCYCTVPLGATSVTIRFKGRAQTAPGTAAVVQPRLYVKSIPDNASVGTWGAAVELTNLTIPTNANFQYDSQTLLLSSIGMSAGGLYQLELTRRVAGITGGTNLTGNWLLVELSFEFL